MPAKTVRVGLLSINSRCFDIAGFGHEVHSAIVIGSDGLQAAIGKPCDGNTGLQVGSDCSFPGLLCASGKTAEGHTKDGWFGALHTGKATPLSLSGQGGASLRNECQRELGFLFG